MDNLDNLSLKELRDLRARVDQAISVAEVRNRQAVMTALDEVARAHGFNSASELVPGIKAPGRAAKAPQAAKYVNPSNPSNTWSGRGRKPWWITEALSAGKNLDDMLIDRPAEQVSLAKGKDNRKK